MCTSARSCTRESEQASERDVVSLHRVKPVYIPPIRGANRCNRLAKVFARVCVCMSVVRVCLYEYCEVLVWEVVFNDVAIGLQISPGATYASSSASSASAW